jgi:hypothetical protein
MEQQQPIRVVDACPCYLAQNLNTIGETLQLLKQQAETTEETRKLLRSLEKELEKCKADYKEHVTGWRERYALSVMDRAKRNILEPLQTSPWKQGDLKRLLEEKPKKTHKRSATQPNDGAIAMASVKKEKVESLED